MALENTYYITLDLKRGMTSTTPTFRQDDNAILIFELFDDGIEYLIDDSTRADITHESPNGSITVISANFTTYNGRKTVRFNYTNQSLLENGIYKTTLSIYDNREKVSFQPFPVIIYSMDNSSSTLADLIKEINKDISNAMLSLRDAIMLWEKGVPNGVASLDANGKIPLSQMPDSLTDFETHINTLIWNEPVHGMRITKPDTDPEVDAGIAQYYVPEENKWQNFGFAPDATGSGGGATPLVDVQIEKADSIVTVTYTGVPTVVLQKWDYGERDTPYFATNGTVFTGNSFLVDRIGMYTLYYKDSNGTEYVRVFSITASDLATPTINVSVENGDVTVDISQATTVKKWAKGQQGIPYFQSQGNVFSGNMFTVTEVGWYTIYYKLPSGAEYIYQFQVDFSMLNGELPIVVRGDRTHSEKDKKYRSFDIGMKDERVTRIRFSGFDSSVSDTQVVGVYDGDGYKYPAGVAGYVDVTKSSGDMTIQFTDANNVVYGTAVHKCRPDYNYFVVNNQYVSLTRIKNSTTNYTLPTTIEGLPVLDAGCVFFTNEFTAVYDRWNTKNLTVPSQILCGGRFASDTVNSTTTIESVRIENSNFKFNTDTLFDIFTSNKTGGIVIYVPANSETYNTVMRRIGSTGHQVQTF